MMVVELLAVPLVRAFPAAMSVTREIVFYLVQCFSTQIRKMFAKYVPLNVQVAAQAQIRQSRIVFLARIIRTARVCAWIPVHRGHTLLPLIIHAFRVTLNVLMDV